MFYVILIVILLLILFFYSFVKFPQKTIVNIFKFASYFTFKYKYYFLAFNYEGDFLDQQILPLLDNRVSTEENFGIKFTGTFKGEKVVILKSFNTLISFTILCTNYKFENIKLEKTIKGRLSC